MRSGNDKQHIFDDPRNVRRVVRGLFIACAILLALDAVIHRHVYHPWEALFGFYAFYGFVACVILVVLAKEMRKVVMRDEDYYERPAAAEDPAPHGQTSDASRTRQNDEAGHA